MADPIADLRAEVDALQGDVLDAAEMLAHRVESQLRVDAGVRVALDAYREALETLEAAEERLVDAERAETAQLLRRAPC